jgi:hypothetical protein
MNLKDKLFFIDWRSGIAIENHTHKVKKSGFELLSWRSTLAISTFLLVELGFVDKINFFLPERIWNIKIDLYNVLDKQTKKN